MHVRLSVCFHFLKKKRWSNQLYTWGVYYWGSKEGRRQAWTLEIYGTYLLAVLQLLKVHIVVYWEGNPPPPNPDQLLHHRRKLQGTVCSPSLATVHSRTDEGIRDQGGDIVAKAFVVLNPNILSIGDVTFGMSTFDPGNSLVPNSEQWAVAAGSWSSHISALHGQRMPAQVQPRSSPAPWCSNPTRPYRHSIAPCTYKKLNWHKQKNSW